MFPRPSRLEEVDLLNANELGEDDISGTHIPEVRLPEQEIPVMTPDCDPISFVEKYSMIGRQNGAIKVRLNEEDLKRMRKDLNPNLIYVDNAFDSLDVSFIKFVEKFEEFKNEAKKETIEIPSEQETSKTKEEPSAVLPEKSAEIQVKKESNGSIIKQGDASAIDVCNGSNTFKNVDEKAHHESETKNDQGNSLSNGQLPDTVNGHTKPIDFLDMKSSMEDLYCLFRAVVAFGGYESVSENVLWPQVAREIGKNSKECSRIQHTYTTHLYKFEKSLGNLLPGLMESRKRPLKFIRPVKAKASKGFILDAPRLMQEVEGKLPPIAQYNFFLANIMNSDPQDVDGIRYTIEDFKKRDKAYRELMYSCTENLRKCGFTEDLFWDSLKSEQCSTPSSISGSAFVQPGDEVWERKKRKLCDPGIKNSTYEIHSSWNPHNVNSLPNSLFGALENESMVGTRLESAMTYGVQNWKVEDHFSQCIDYHIEGAPKRWYFIPESQFESFEKLWREKKESKRNNENINTESEGVKSEQSSGEPYTRNPTFRFSHSNPKWNQFIESHCGVDIPLITPETLREYNITFFTTLQHPGEIVVKYPKTYSMCFSLGLSFSENVNFASSIWLDCALEGEKWLQKNGFIPGFSTFKLLVNLVHLYDLGKPIATGDVFKKVGEIYETLYQEEMAYRNKIRAWKIESGDGESIIGDDLGTVYPAGIVLREKKSATFSMSLPTFCKFYEEGKIIGDPVFTVFLSDDKLRHYLRVFKSYSVDFESWTRTYEELFANEDLPVRIYKSFLSDGERIYAAAEHIEMSKLTVFVGHLENLRNFLGYVNSLIEESQRILSIKHHQRTRGADFQSVDKLSELVALSAKINKVPASCSEFEQIVEFLTEIENFDKAARHLLAKKGHSNEEFSDLISLGESFGIAIPSLSFLKRVRDRIEWINIYQLIEKGVDPYKDKKAVFSIKDLEEFLDKGREVLSKKDESMLEESEKFLSNSKRFDEEIVNFLAVDDYLTLDLEKLANIADRFATEKLFISEKTYEELSRVHLNSGLIKAFRNIDKKGYTSAKQLFVSLSESGLKMDLRSFELDLKCTENWTKKLSDALNFSVASTILEEGKTTQEKLNRLLQKAEFNYGQQDKFEISSSWLYRKEKEQESMEDNNEEEIPTFYCLCREYEHGTMIECDRCQEWYHVQCVKNKEDAENDSYVCPVCLYVEGTTLDKHLSFDEVNLLIEEGKQLRFVAPDFELLTDVSQQMQEYERQMNLLEEDAGTNIGKLQWILRKVYGAGIVFEKLMTNIAQKLRTEEEKKNPQENGKTELNGKITSGASSVPAYQSPASFSTSFSLPNTSLTHSSFQEMSNGTHPMWMPHGTLPAISSYPIHLPSVKVNSDLLNFHQFQEVSSELASPNSGNSNTIQHRTDDTTNRETERSAAAITPADDVTIENTGKTIDPDGTFLAQQSDSQNIENQTQQPSKHVDQPIDSELSQRNEEEDRIPSTTPL